MGNDIAGRQSIRWAYFADTLERVDAAVLVLSGEWFHALRVEVFRSREAQRRGDADARQLLCGYCDRPVYATGRREGAERRAQPAAPGSAYVHRWFRHYERTAEDAADLCPWTAGDTSQSPEAQRAAMYAGLPESKKHFRLKTAIADAVRSDPRNVSVLVDRVRMARTLIDPNGRRERRSPDVLFERDGVEWAIELQASPLLGTDAAGRDRYYRREGVRLLWVFASRDPGQFTQEDEAAKNRGQVFTFGRTAARDSAARGRLVLMVHGPDFSRLVALDELATDPATRRPYFDAMGARRRMSALQRAREIASEMRMPGAGHWAFPAGPGRIASIADRVLIGSPDLRHVLAASLMAFRPLGTNADGLPVDERGRLRKPFRKRWGEAYLACDLTRSEDGRLAKEFPELAEMLAEGVRADAVLTARIEAAEAGTDDQGLS
jgi:hypothetical protein